MALNQQELIKAAIGGLEAQRAYIESQRLHIDGQLAELRALLDDDKTNTPKRSPETIQRMREAQQRRWAKVKGKQEPAAAVPPKKAKRKLSAAGRKNIIDAIKRRWAAKKAK